MLDHTFTDAIGSLRDAIEAALLERQDLEERFNSDVLLGDLTWETAYSLPGEGTPPRVRTDIRLGWSTWSQTSYRGWYLDGEVDEPPHIDVELVFRVQRLSTEPDPAAVLEALPDRSTRIGNDTLLRSGPSLETVYDHALENPEHAIEVTYGGSYELDEGTLADGGKLDEHFAAVGDWIASTLVRIGDLPLDYLPEPGPPGL